MANVPNLILLCGIPGCGKSTLANAHAENNLIVLSSDAMRGVLGKDESDQSVSGDVFRILELVASYFLKRGNNVVIDATNCTRKARKGFVQIGRKYGANIVAQVMSTPLDVCKARNAARARVVPEHVLERMHAGFEMPVSGEVDMVQTF